ncbi:MULTISPECIES: hypothetical protein [Virgibacillus]|uniref:hypothetical protein n=1 Tax=Virgibacillus TaxID=84406 RepID=UPI0012DEACD1|nr:MULTISPECIES: hypothetical protein [Virgibacillus]MYL43504.1 hypothetical protein [Virgibacillus massiliensis]
MDSYVEYIFLSTIIIFLLLFSLIQMYQRVTSNPNSTFLDYAPFAIYFGWVSLASIVNLFTYLVRNNLWPILRISELGWTILTLIIVSIITLLVTVRKSDFLYPLVFIWTFIAIYVKAPYELLQWVLVACSILVGIGILIAAKTK